MLEYNRTEWVQNKTKLNSRNLNNIENGISNCVKNINKLESNQDSFIIEKQGEELRVKLKVIDGHLCIVKA